MNKIIKYIVYIAAILGIIAIIAAIVIAIIKVVCGLIDAGEFMINEIKTEIRETESEDIYL